MGWVGWWVGGWVVAVGGGGVCVWWVGGVVKGRGQTGSSVLCQGAPTFGESHSMGAERGGGGEAVTPSRSLARVWLLALAQQRRSSARLRLLPPSILVLHTCPTSPRPSRPPPPPPPPPPIWRATLPDMHAPMPHPLPPPPNNLAEEHARGRSPVAPQDLDGVQGHAGGGLGGVQNHRRAVLAVGSACRQ